MKVINFFVAENCTLCDNPFSCDKYTIINHNYGHSAGHSTPKLVLIKRATLFFCTDER